MTVDQTNPLNVEILNAQLAKEAWYATWFSKLAGFMSQPDTNKNDLYHPAPNVVIQVLDAFIQAGRDNMLLPMLKPLEDPGVYGDSQLIGTGEELDMRYLRAYINQHRKAAIKKSGAMSIQRTKIYDMMEKVKPEVVRWWSKTENQAISQCLYEGVSPNLSIGTDDYGLGLKKRFHPNMYIHGSSSPADGQITAVGTEFYTKIVSEITTMVTSARVLTASAKMLEAFRIYCNSVLLIEPLATKDGHPFWIMLAHPRTFKALRADSTIKTDQNSAFNTKLMEHPALNGKNFLYYAGFVIIEDPISVRSLYTATTTPELNLAAGDLRKGWLLPALQTSGYLFGSIILGRDAIGKGLANSLSFTEETTDHGNVIEIGSNQIYGYNRADYFSETDEASVFNKNNATSGVLDTAYAAKNQSSAIIFTED